MSKWFREPQPPVDEVLEATGMLVQRSRERAMVSSSGELFSASISRTLFKPALTSRYAALLEVTIAHWFVRAKSRTRHQGNHFSGLDDSKVISALLS
jgi:hypothetical protein